AVALGRPRDPVMFAVVLCDREFRGLGVQWHVQPRPRRTDRMLRRGAAVPEIHGRLRPAVDRRPVRWRVACPTHGAARRHRHPRGLTLRSPAAALWPKAGARSADRGFVLGPTTCAAKAPARRAAARPSP